MLHCDCLLATVAMLAKGLDPMAQRHGQRDAPKMSRLFDRYLSDYAKMHKKPASLRNDVRMIENRLRPVFGHYRVGAVTRQQVRAFHAAMEDKPYEANRQLALLSKIFSFAADELEWIARGDHPVKGIKRFEEKKRKRYLSQVEIARLGEALAKAEAGELPKSISSVRKGYRCDSQQGSGVKFTVRLDEVAIRQEPR